jgi:uncharacterized protein RhaS with RHS repeats
VSADQRSPVDAWTYTIDKAGRMSGAPLNGSLRATFAYDAFERRIVKTALPSGAVTHYIYDGEGQLLAEMNGATGAVLREYVWLGGVPVGYIEPPRVCRRP